MNNEETSLNAQQEELELLLDEARKDLLTFCQLHNPRFEVVWFHEVIAAALEKALKNTLEKKKTRIILTIPPRHGKTQLASIYFPAWVLGKYPHIKFILSTYGADLSEDVGMKTRDLISSEEYQSIFPGIELKADTRAKAKWMVTQNGQTPGGSFTGVGIGGAITGRGADIILLDDPHKDRAEAESETMREMVYEYYRSTLYSRLEGFGAIILIMQRWHTDDLVGRLLEEAEKNRQSGAPADEWEIINFPAIAEVDEPPHRKAGEALWPSKFSLDVLANIRQTAGVYNWSSQYMQDPILAETQEFKQTMFRTYEQQNIENLYLRYYTFIDPAISQKQEADNTVVLTIAKEVYGPNIYRIREDAGHFTPSQTVEILFKHQKEFRSEVYLETVAYQLALKFSIEEEQLRRQQYFTVNEVKTRTNKEVKIRGMLPLYERGVIFHRPGDHQYEKELISFPRGKRDDRIDAMSMCLEVLDNTPNSQTSRQFKPHWTGYGKRK